MRTALVSLLLLVAAPCAHAASLLRIATPAALLSAPVDSGLSLGNVFRDQVVRVTGRAPGWVDVERGDGVDGWVHAPAGSRVSCLPLALGTINAGRLKCGWTLAADTDTWTTWDYPLGRSPSRAWRRHGTAQLIWLLERVASDMQDAHPGLRLVIGDLSRPHGGSFGPQYGAAGHASHQMGVDADVLYPRRDGLERPATRPSQVDLGLARELIRRFGREPEVQIMFVGCERDYVSASPKAERLCNHEHEDHVHVRVRRTFS